MTAREKTSLKSKIRRRVKNWVKTMCLSDWELELVFQDYADTETQESEDGWVHFAHADPSWEYKSARVSFYLVPLSTLADREVERWVVHELGHVLLCEMREKDKEFKHEERTVTHLTKVLMDLKYGD
jgi:hypothetical protein